MLTQLTVTSDQYPPRPWAGAGLVAVWAWQEAGPEWQPRQSVLTSSQPLRRCRLYTDWRNWWRVYLPQKNAEVCEGFG